MKLCFKKARWQQDNEGLWLCLLAEDRAIFSRIRQFVDAMKDRLYQAELGVYHPKRSTDANAYLWALLEEMAIPMHISKDEAYIEMLTRYGVFTHIIVKPEAVKRFSAEYRAVRNLGEVTVNGKTGIQLQCYYGSSTYDSKEMSRLIDGVVSECKLLDIETATPAELARMKDEWGR